MTFILLVAGIFITGNLPKKVTHPARSQPVSSRIQYQGSVVYDPYITHIIQKKNTLWLFNIAMENHHAINR